MMATPLAAPAAKALAPLVPGTGRMVAGIAAVTLLLLGCATTSAVTLLGSLFDASPLDASLPAWSPSSTTVAVTPPAPGGAENGRPTLPSSIGPVAGGQPLGGSDLGATAVALAWQQQGVPYVWGGADPRTGLDCSGLVQWVYRQLGVLLPRTAQQQHTATVPVRTADLHVGDLVFFAHTYQADPAEPITHVGIYIGGGRMLNAPREGETVQEAPVFTGFWGAHYAGAGRVPAAASAANAVARTGSP